MYPDFSLILYNSTKNIIKRIDSHLDCSWSEDTSAAHLVIQSLYIVDTAKHTIMPIFDNNGQYNFRDGTLHYSRHFGCLMIKDTKTPRGEREESQDQGFTLICSIDHYLKKQFRISGDPEHDFIIDFFSSWLR